MRTAPTVVLEVLLELLPLLLLIKREGKMAISEAITNLNKVKFRTSQRDLESIIRKDETLPITLVDAMPLTYNFEAKFKFVFATRKYWS